MKKRTPTSAAFKAIKKYGYETTQQRDALKRRPRLSPDTIKRKRKLIKSAFKNRKAEWKYITESMHKNFASVDKFRAGMACPLEQERTRSAMERLVGAIEHRGDYETVLHVTSALPQHTVVFGKLDSVSPQSVRRKMADQMREIRNDYPSAFSVGIVEVQGIRIQDQLYWSVHMHSLVFNVPAQIVKSKWNHRKIRRLESAYQTIYCRHPETKHALLVWSNYITKFTVYGSIYSRKRGHYLPHEKSSETMPTAIRREVTKWYANYTASNLVSFVGVPQRAIKKFHGAEMESILCERNEFWQKVIGSDYLW